MLRDPYLNDNGAQNRADIVLAEAKDDATRWISAQHFHCFCLSIFPAQRSTSTIHPKGCGGTIHDFQSVVSDGCCTPCCPTDTAICIRPDVGTSSCVVLEKKFGGRPDCTATIVKVFKLDGSPQMWDPAEETGGFHSGKSCACRGFYRLRVIDYADPVQLSIHRVNASESH